MNNLFVPLKNIIVSLTHVCLCNRTVFLFTWKICPCPRSSVIVNGVECRFNDYVVDFLLSTNVVIIMQRARK